MEITKNIINEIEELIEKIDAIISCRLVVNEKGDMIELHVLSNDSRAPKQIIRDIQSAVMARYEIKIDHKIISVAQIFEEMRKHPILRLIINSVDYQITDMIAKVKVVLKFDDKEYIGQCEGVHTARESIRILGNATLNAIKEFLPGREHFILEDIKEVAIANDKLVLVAITMINRGYESLFVGKSIVNNDMNKAVVRATLDSLNRYLQSH